MLIGWLVGIVEGFNPGCAEGVDAGYKEGWLEG